MVGGGCCLLRLSTKISSIREQLDNEEQKVIIRKEKCLLLIIALAYLISAPADRSRHFQESFSLSRTTDS